MNSQNVQQNISVNGSKNQNQNKRNVNNGNYNTTTTYNNNNKNKNKNKNKTNHSGDNVMVDENDWKNDYSKQNEKVNNDDIAPGMQTPKDSTHDKRSNTMEDWSVYCFQYLFTFSSAFDVCNFLFLFFRTFYFLCLCCVVLYCICLQAVKRHTYCSSSLDW